MEQEYSLKKFFKSPFSLKILPYLMLLFAGLGFLDAAYLTIDHYRNVAPPCTIHGCEIVLRSQFAEIASIPVSLLGVLFYVAMLILAGLYLQTKKQNILLLLFIFSGLSLLFSAYFVYLQAFVLLAFCQYCLFAEFMNFLLFDTVWWLWNSKKNS